MGQDVSIVLVARKIPAKRPLKAATRAFSENRSANLLILYSQAGPVCLRRALPAFTAASVWSDAEDDLDRFASGLSLSLGKALVITMADHSCLGGWQVFENGQGGEGEWLEGDGYTDCGIRGIERCWGVELQPTAKERLFFVESFLQELSGICVLGSAGGLQAGAPLQGAQVQAIMEHDLAGAELECLLLAG
jgi:hypothetical protein